MRWIALLVFLFALPAFAQDQTLAPDGENGPANVYDDHDAATACSNSTACSTADCHLDVDETAATGGDGLEVCTETQDATIRFTFPTPSSNPDTGTNAQAIDLVMTCFDADTDMTESCTGNPPFSLEIYCNGAALTTPQTPFSGETITATDQDKTANFTFDTTDCATDGSDLEFHFTLGRSAGPLGDRRWAAIEAIEWEVTHASASTRNRILLVE